MNLQNAPFISAVAAFIGAAAIMMLTGVGWVAALVGGVLVAIVAYLVTSWQTRRMSE
jgi:uncharacterized membrane protein